MNVSLPWIIKLQMSANDSARDNGENMNSSLVWNFFLAEASAACHQPTLTLELMTLITNFSPLLQIEREKTDLSVQVISLSERLEEAEGGAESQVNNTRHLARHLRADLHTSPLSLSRF